MERVVVVRRVRARRDCVEVSWMVLKWDGEGRKGGLTLMDGIMPLEMRDEGFNLVKRVLGL